MPARYIGAVSRSQPRIRNSVEGAAQVVDILALEDAMVKFGHNLVDALLNFVNLIEEESKLFFEFFDFFHNNGRDHRLQGRWSWSAE